MASKEYRYVSSDIPPDEWGTYLLWSCAGCDTCTLEDKYSAEYMVRADGEYIYESIFHPKRSQTTRPSKHFQRLPVKLKLLYGEVMSSFNERLHLLCAAGLRALAEGICADKGIKGKNLEDKIDGMKRLLPASIVKNLHSFRFIGNKALHELAAPSDFELGLAIDVIEDILNFLYDLDYKAKMLTNVRNAMLDSQLTRGSDKPASKSSPGDQKEKP